MKVHNIDARKCIADAVEQNDYRLALLMAGVYQSLASRLKTRFDALSDDATTNSAFGKANAMAALKNSFFLAIFVVVGESRLRMLKDMKSCVCKES